MIQMDNLLCEWLECKIFHSFGIEYIPKKYILVKQTSHQTFIKYMKVEVC